ncbi:hypothetical protein WR25_23913 [Diploscapter pachys]|uniref:Uncharacterized protein n=1 Tax=Diploscapter pachys TaxID=2018661 RepID=A0A2A2KDE5_9BILA|nr:hypothetical protein WR25_23913 [Diploscapter pachys]
MEKESLADYAARTYIEIKEGSEHRHSALRELDNALDSAIQEALDPVKNETEPERVGFAVKLTKHGGSLPSKATEYLTQVFNDGAAKRRRKADPREIAKQMPLMKDEHGRKVFAPNECLSWQQITSYFSQLSKKAKQNTPATVTPKPRSSRKSKPIEPVVLADEKMVAEALKDMAEDEGEPLDEYLKDPELVADEHDEILEKIQKEFPDNIE